MKASELIKKLADQITIQGNLEVIIHPKLTKFDVFNGDTDYTENFMSGCNDYKNHIVIDEV
jgi:hypothetical protein